MESLTNWRLERLAVVDRAILRLGTAEMMFVDDVPPRMCIREMVQLAEKYGTRESAALRQRRAGRGDAARGPGRGRRGLKILVLNWQDLANPQSGGAEIHLHEIFGRLAARGHEVTLLCSGWPGARARAESGGMQIHRTGGRNTFSLAAPALLPPAPRRRSRGTWWWRT